MNFCPECGRPLSGLDDAVCLGCGAPILDLADALAANADLNARLETTSRELGISYSYLSHIKAEAAAMREVLEECLSPPYCVNATTAGAALSTSAGADLLDEVRRLREAAQSGQDAVRKQLDAEAGAAVLRHALDSVVCDFMPGPDSGCDSRGVEPSLVEGAAPAGSPARSTNHPRAGRTGAE